MNRVMNRRLCHFTVGLNYCSSTFQTGWVAKLTEVTGYSSTEHGTRCLGHARQVLCH